MAKRAIIIAQKVDYGSAGGIDRYIAGGINTVDTYILKELVLQIFLQIWYIFLADWALPL